MRIKSRGATFLTFNFSFSMLNIDDRLIKEVLPQIGPNAFSVLMAISVHLDANTMTAFPSNERLGKMTGLGRDAVYSAVKKLIDFGILLSSQEKESESGKFGRRTVQVNTDYISIYLPAKKAKPFTGQPYTGEPFTADPVHNILSIEEQINQEEQINKKENSEFLKITIHDTPKVEFLPLEENSEIKSVEGYNHARAASGLQVEPKPETQQSKPKRKSKNEAEEYTYADIAKHLEITVQVFFRDIIQNLAWPEWVEYKKVQFRFQYKAALYASKAIQELFRMSQGKADIAKKIVDQSIGRAWQGFVQLPIEQPQRQPYQQQQPNRQRSEVDGLIFSR